MVSMFHKLEAKEVTVMYSVKQDVQRNTRWYDKSNSCSVHVVQK